MAIKTYRPITPSLRFKTTLTNDELTTNKPHKPLTSIKLRTGGRRNAGDITIWHRGGGHKRKLRDIDFKRDKNGVPGDRGFDRIRSQSLSAHRADRVCRRREALHPSSRGIERGPEDRAAVPKPTSLWGTRCR